MCGVAWPAARSRFGINLSIHYRIRFPRLWRPWAAGASGQARPTPDSETTRHEITSRARKYSAGRTANLGWPAPRTPQLLLPQAQAWRG